MSKTKRDYEYEAKDLCEHALHEKDPIDKTRLFLKAAENYAHAGLETKAYESLERGLKVEKEYSGTPLPKLKKFERKERKDIQRLLDEAQGIGLVGKIAKALGLGVFIIIGLYFLSSSNTTGNVVNLSRIGSSFLVNFILIGILGLVCYHYLK